jgi:DNA mismatch repair protein MutL
MGKIHVLPEHVANKIAAGEVVERPASVVKELLENALDAGARRIRVNVEGGGKKLIQVSDDGCGMLRDDALLAFERHATSKLKNAEDLLSVSTLGFRGEALPSIASVSRLRLETRAEQEAGGTVIEIVGGKILRLEEAGLPAGTSLTVRDLFFNTPARKKFLRAESTELSHIASLVTHYSLAHPGKHFELHSASNAMLIAAPVGSAAERIYQVFGKDTLDQLIPLAAAMPLERMSSQEGELRVHGFVSKPEIQKLNRNSIFFFVNGRLIRDRLIQHALTEAYRNILPPAVFPVVLLFIELPCTEIDVNVHPSKTEVRFRQQTLVHDFVRETIRAALLKARPVAHFTREMTAQPNASVELTPGARGAMAPHMCAPDVGEGEGAGEGENFALTAPAVAVISGRLGFDGSIEVEGNAALPVARIPHESAAEGGCATPELAGLKPLGQVRDSFIVAVDHEDLWIVDQHAAHERVLFERVIRQRTTERVESQRLLMPLIIELAAQQQAVFAEISDELRRNGFEVEPFGSRTVAVKTAPAGVEASDLERLLHELLDQFQREEQALNLEMVRGRIAASIACHAAIKVNTPLEQNKMEWLLRELALTECPMTCPHGRPVVLRYSVKDIQRAFKRI